jgi:ABC-type Fe3+-hydroxamate transport system, periplasmic component
MQSALITTMNARRLPARIVCLTTETVEVLYALGEDARIAGISGYTVIPPRARKEKPKVFAFSSGDLAKILAVEPDLVLGFSDMQADVARDLIKAGVAVHVFNQRSVDDILAMIETVGRLVGAEDKALALVAELEATMADVQAQAPGCRVGRGSIRGVGRAGRSARCAGCPSSSASPAARTSSPSARTTRAPHSASSPTRWRRRGGRRTSSSAPGAASASAPSGWWRAQAGRTCRRCVMVSCTR